MRKKILLYSGVALGVVLLLFGTFIALALLAHPTHAPIYGHEEDEVTLQIESDDLVILNLTDVQLCDLEDVGRFDVIKAEIDELVNRAKPDLITLTGDLTWSNENNISLHALIRWLDGYGIPWAPVVGNHDLGNDVGDATASGDYWAYLLENSKYGLFRHGNPELGMGNYVVKVMHGDTLVKVLYMMDTGTTDVVSEAQKTWFETKASAIESAHGQTDGMVFMHKPLSEYQSAYNAFLRRLDGVTATGNVFAYCALWGVDSNGFFEILKTHGVTDVVCGHQHTNAFTLTYQGVRLTFALKTGELSFYWDDGEDYLNGGTVFTCHGNDVTVTQLTVDRDRYRIAGSDNQYVD